MITAIVLNYNKEEYLKRCLDSLLRQTVQGLHILVVENGSTDESRAILSNYPSIEILSLEQNNGAAGGRNRGIEALFEETEYVLFLDSDMELEKNAIHSLQGALEKEARFSLCGPLVYQGKNKQDIISAGGFFYPSLARLALRKGKYSEERYSEREEVDFLPGCCLLVRGNALKSIGYFREEFDPYGMEDIDFTLRAKEKGFLSIFVPEAKANHLAHYSFFHETPERAFTTTRNRLLLGKLHCSSGKKAVFLGAFFLRWFLLRSLLLLLSGNLLSAFAVVKGTIVGMSHFFTSNDLNIKEKQEV